MKQRLIGAVVLVALAVIFLPMLIKGPAPDSGVSDVSLRVPDAPDGPYETRELPLVSPDGAPAGGALGLPATTPEPTASATPAPSTQAGPAPVARADGDYAVSFGAYASAADADRVLARLKQAQLPGYREAASINGRDAYRVRVGPYTDRASAESARLEAVKVRNDVNAQVVVLNAGQAQPAALPDAAHPATPPATSGASAATQPAQSVASVATQPLPSESTRPTNPVTPPKPAPATTPPKSAPAAATPKPTAQTAPPKPAPASTPAQTPQPAAATVGFAVQLGAFSNAAEANALRDKARAGGFSAFVEQVRTDKGMLSRVRVGPVASRADADHLKTQVQSKLGISGMVRPHP